MYELVLTEGKGEGLVTVADIPAGTLLVSEPPALRVTLTGGDLSPMAGVDVSRQFSGKNKAERKVITDLANIYGDEDEVLGIFKTNAMIISSCESALFPWVCRANHSCVPNCNYMWNEEVGEQQMFAVEMIPVGTELTVSYLPDNFIEGVEMRRKMILEQHNFVCMCQSCIIATEGIKNQEESDRKEAKRLIGEINLLTLKIKMDLTQSMQKTKYKELCLKLLKNLNSMNIHLTSIYLIKTCLFYISVLSCEEEEAVLWAAELLKMSRILTGAESYQTQSWSYSVHNMRSYFLDKESLLEDVKDWSICI